MNFKGKIYWRGDEGYENARVGRVFNHRRPERYPNAVFFPKDEKDVIAAVQFANDKNYKIAIRAGGHSWAAWSVRDEGILLDLQHLNQIQFDEKTNIAKVQPAVKGGLELNPFLKQYNRFFCGGHCPTVGVGGFLLQGGQGWNARGWGWAAESIVAIDVVTAAGEFVRADATQNQDLYWAARGAGPGFFGVITCFHLQTRPLSKFLIASTYLYPTQYCQPILKWLQDIHHTVADTVELVAVGQSVPNLEGVEGTNIPVVIVHALTFNDDEMEAYEALKPFESCPFLEKAYVRRTNYHTSLAEQIQLQLEANPEKYRWVVNNAWLEGDSEQVSTLIAPAFTHLPDPKAFALWYSMAPLRKLPDMAFSMQTEIYFAVYALWEDAKHDEPNKNWLKSMMQRIQPITAGQYLGDSDFTVHQRKFISNENWEKLEAIRAQRDPQRRFHTYLTNEEKTLNQNKFL
jgi:FAD/FMN-containing dehydrogenase